MKNVQIGTRKYTAYWLSSILGFIGFALTMLAFIFVTKEGVELLEQYLPACEVWGSPGGAESKCRTRQLNQF